MNGKPTMKREFMRNDENDEKNSYSKHLNKLPQSRNNYRYINLITAYI